MNFFSSPLWQNILQILRDPIFAIFLTIFIALLASRRVKAFIRIILLIAVIGSFIWLITTNKSVANIIVEIIHDVFLLLIIVLPILLVAGVIAAFILYRHYGYLLPWRKENQRPYIGSRRAFRQEDWSDVSYQLPPAIRRAIAAMERGDEDAEEAFEEAFEALSPVERFRVINVLEKYDPRAGRDY